MATASASHTYSGDKTGNDEETSWALDRRNPHTWSRTRKNLMIILISSIGFVATLGSSIYAPARLHATIDLNVSDNEISILPISLYNLGMGLGPLIASPLSETFGRRVVYLSVLPLYCLFVMASGLAQDMAMLAVFRFLAGVFASPSVAIAAASIADMYPPEERSLPLIIYYSTPTLGALCGPLLGSFVVERQGWRWTAWTTLILAAPTFIPVLFTRESYKKVLLASRPQHDDSSQFIPSWNSIHNYLLTHLARPLHMLLFEPICSFLCLYMGFQFGLMYLFVVSSPQVYAETYGFSPTAQGLSFLGLICGVLLASLCLILLELRFYRPKAAALARSGHHVRPEDRLHSAMLGSLILPLGLFLFAFATRSSVHWIVPMIAQGMVSFASLIIYVPSGMYLMAAYGASHGASASGANSLMRYALASSFPLFSDRLYHALGTDGATGLLAGLTVLMAGIPWVLRRWGSSLRRRSAYVIDE